MRGWAETEPMGKEAAGLGSVVRGTYIGVPISPPIQALTSHHQFQKVTEM